MAGEYQIAETVRKPNEMDRQIRGLLGHSRLLRGTGEDIEAQPLLESANQLCMLESGPNSILPRSAGG